MNVDDYYSELQHLTNRRSALLHEGGKDCRVIGSEATFKGFLADAGDFGMFAADARLNSGDIFEAQGQKYLVTSLEAKPGCRIGRVDPIKSECEILSEIKTPAGSVFKAGRKLAVFDNNGGTLTVMMKQALPAGSIVKVGSFKRVVTKAIGHLRPEFARLVTEPYSPATPPNTSLKTATAPDWTRGAPGTLPIRGKAF